MANERISDLLNDFIVYDRRIVDQPDLMIRLDYFKDGVLSLPGMLVRPAFSLVPNSVVEHRTGKQLFSEDAFCGNGPSILACPLISNEKKDGWIALISKKPFDRSIIPRIKVLSAIVSYELFHLGERKLTHSQLSEELGRVLKKAREEISLTQEELASYASTTRISLSRWESGAQPPSRGPLRRWATALGLLAGGKSNLITVADATPEILQLAKSDSVNLSLLSPEQFENLIFDIFVRMGYSVIKTGKTNLRDGGIDLIAVPKLPLTSFLVAVQVKHHCSGNKTGRDAVDRLLAWQNSTFRTGVLVTNTHFSRDAIWAASQATAKNFIRLRDFADVSRWLQGIFTPNLDWREIPDSVELAPGIRVTVPKPTFSEADNLWFKKHL